jgi:hypothetical protein
MGNKYGGTTTNLNTLDVGTKFYVNNGAWDGTIVLKDGKKCVLVGEDDLENAIEITDERTLDITIKGIVEIDPDACCDNEVRGWDGWCKSCGDPSIG